MISDLDLGQTTEPQVHGSRFPGERGDRVADKAFEVIPLIRWVPMANALSKGRKYPPFRFLRHVGSSPSFLRHAL
jgi:hypothetical protein